MKQVHVSIIDSSLYTYELVKKVLSNIFLALFKSIHDSKIDSSKYIDNTSIANFPFSESTESTQTLSSYFRL